MWYQLIFSSTNLGAIDCYSNGYKWLFMVVYEYKLLLLIVANGYKLLLIIANGYKWLLVVTNAC